MRNKLMLEIYLPASGQHMEMRIPGQLKAGQVKDMLVEYLKKQDGEFIPTRDCVLCDMEDGRPLDANTFMGNAGLHNGSQLMLV